MPPSHCVQASRLRPSATVKLNCLRLACSVVDELGIPIKFVGVGETVDDLQPFDAKSFVDALFPSVEHAALV